MELPSPKPAKVTLLGLALVFLLAFAPRAFALTDGQAASLVIGESSLTAFAPRASATALVAPFDIVFDSSHNLWVADVGANRILEYKAPFSTGEAASLVIGQTSLTSLSSGTTPSTLSSPQDIAFDPSGNLWVSDSANNRVLEFKAPLSTGESASVVIGQGSFTSKGFDTTNATSLNSPYGLAFDSSGNLWVADLLNGRVLEYAAPFSNHEAANLVIGETSMTVSTDQVSKAGLNAPNSVTFDSKGDLWIVDGHRALEYNAPFATHEGASIVIGQNNFQNSSTVASTTGTNLPNGMAFDSGGNLWLADRGNNRVLEYPAPQTTGEAATLVLGQRDFTGSSPPPATMPTASSLNQPNSVAFDGSGNLWVSDGNAGRVLQFGGTTTPEFPAFAVPLVFVAVLVAAMLLVGPRARIRPALA